MFLSQRRDKKEYFKMGFSLLQEHVQIRLKANQVIFQ